MLVEELVNLTPSAMMELFELNVRELPGFDENDPLDIEVGLPLDQVGIYRFYNWGLNELDDSVIWQGNRYQAYPIEARGFSLEGEKQVPRPTLTISNLGTVVQELVNKYDDILGGKLTRKVTFAKYLDEENFSGWNGTAGSGNPNADPTSEFPDTVYYVRKKTSESIEVVSFELSSPWDVEGVKLPRRVMNSNICPWQYRDGNCGYVGNAYFKANDDSTLEPAEDVCGKRLQSCLLRFPGKQPVPFGGFAGLRE